jgi:cathepsin L
MRYVIHNHGIDTETSYPYTAMDGTCSFNKSNVGATFKQTVNITSGDMNALYHAIAHVGPISVAIDAEDDFQFYSSGIFNSTTCSKDQLDHAVLAVGYSVTEDGHKYIMIKNSWGGDWGMNGYIYFSADQDNMCGVATDASYPMV